MGFSTRGYGALSWDGSGDAVVRHLPLPAGAADSVAGRGVSGWDDAVAWGTSVAVGQGWYEGAEVAGVTIQRRRGLGAAPVAAVVLRHLGRVIPLAALAPGPVRDLELVEVRAAGDGRHAVATVTRSGVMSLHVLDLARARAVAHNANALEAWRQGHRGRAAAAWEAAWAADPSFGDAPYNLACIHTLAGDFDRAEAELALALAIDPRRFVSLARTDRDLAALRQLPEVRRQLRLRPDD